MHFPRLRPGAASVLLPILLLAMAAHAAPATAPEAGGPTLEQVESEVRRDLERAEPGDGGAQLALGERLIAEGRAAEAVPTLKAAVSGAKGAMARGRALIALGRAQGLAGEHTLAITCFDLVLRDGPAALASEAQLQKAILESRHLLTPARFRQVIRRFSVESPLTLDFDLVRHMVGVGTGYRLDQIDLALGEFQKVWEKYPRGSRAADAMLHQALIEGLVLSRVRVASNRVERLARMHAGTPEVDVGRVLQALMAMSEGRHADALEALEKVSPGSEVAPEALFLGGMASAYYLDRPEDGARLFAGLEKVAEGHWRDVGIYHQALLAFAVRRDPEAARTLLGRLPVRAPGAELSPEPADKAGDSGQTKGTKDEESARLGALRHQLDVYVQQVAEAKNPAARDFAFASFWHANHHYSRALRELDAFLKNHPDAPQAAQARFLKGKIQQDDVGQLDGARRSLAEAMPTAPAALREELRYREALTRMPEKDARTALEAIYKDEDAVFKPLVGIELAKRGALTEPEKVQLYADVIRREPSSDVRARLLTQLARVYRDSGNPRRALEVYGSALPLDSKLGAEIAKTRALVEVADIESQMARSKRLGYRGVDGSALLRLGRLHLALGQVEEAKKAFRAAQRAMPGASAEERQARQRRQKAAREAEKKRRVRAAKGAGREADEDEERSLSSPGSEVADAARLELLRLNVKDARYAPQELRYVNDFIKTLSRQSPVMPEAVAVKLDVLERDQAKPDVLIPLYRYLIQRGHEVEGSSVKLARTYLAGKQADQAARVLSGVKWSGEHGPEAMLVLAEAHEKLGRPGEAGDALHRLVERWPSASQAREAGNRLAGLLGRELDRALAGAQGHEQAITRFLTRMQPQWVAAARRSIDRLTVEPTVGGLTPGQLDRLVELLGGAQQPDHALVARLQGIAAGRASEPRASQLKVEQALSLASAGEPEKAVGLLIDVAAQQPAALLHLAALQEKVYQDRPAAVKRLDELLARSDARDEDRTQAVLRKASLVQEDPVPLVEAELARTEAPVQRALMLERLGQLERDRDKGQGKPSQDLARKVSARYLAASAAAPEMDEKVRLGLEASRILMDAGLHDQASASLKTLRELTSAEDPDRVDPRIAEYFQRNEASSQLTRLARGISVEDPESPTNLQVMLSQARLLISPLKEYDRAQSLLSQIEGQFPEASREQVQGLRREMAHRWSLRALEEKTDKMPRDLMRLAVTLEEELDDAVGAARYLRELVANHPDDPLALVARFRLIRLLALHLNRRQEAARLARGLKSLRDAAEFKPEVTAAFNLVLAQERYERLRLEMERLSSDHPAGTPETIARLASMGRLAVEDFRDQSLAREVLDRMLRYKAGPAAEDVRREGFRLALSAAVELPASRAAVYALTERAGFLQTASDLARPGLERSRVRYEQGLDQLRAGAVEEAARAFDEASREAPSTPFGREALLELAQLEEGRSNARGARDAWERLQKASSEGPYLKLASKKLPRMEKMARSAEREAELTDGRDVQPLDYYRTAEEQLEEGEDLEKALTNFRTYIRLGRDEDRQVNAHVKSAEILARLDRGREATEMLERAIKAYPDHGRVPEMTFRLGQVREVQMGDAKGAEKIYRTVQKRWPKSKWAKQSAAAGARIAAARSEKRQIAATAEKPSGISAEIAAIREKYIKEEQGFDRAIDALKAMVEATSVPADRAELNITIGQIYETNLKDYRSAVEHYQKYLEDSTNQEQCGTVFLNIAALKADKLKEPQEALEMYQQFGTKYYNHPSRIPAQMAMAQLLESKLADVQGALDIYRNIADSYPRSGYDEQALLRTAQLSRTHFADYSGAVEALRRLVRDYPFSDNAAYSQLQVANILEVELGDKTSAAVEYQRLIDAYPQSGYADAARAALVRLRAPNQR